MVLQLALGLMLIVLTIIVAGLGFMVMEALLSHRQAWLVRPPHRPKLLILLVSAAVWILIIATAGVWIWALAYFWLGIFGTMEEATYFSLIAFTTFGFGDLLLPPEWRLLSGISAINGLLMIGLQTAFLIEAVRKVRAFQIGDLS